MSCTVANDCAFNHTCNDGVCTSPDPKNLAVCTYADGQQLSGVYSYDVDNVNGNLVPSGSDEGQHGTRGWFLNGMQVPPGGKYTGSVACFWRPSSAWAGASYNGVNYPDMNYGTQVFKSNLSDFTKCNTYSLPDPAAPDTRCGPNTVYCSSQGIIGCPNQAGRTDYSCTEQCKGVPIRLYDPYNDHGTAVWLAGDGLKMVTYDGKGYFRAENANEVAKGLEYGIYKVGGAGGAYLKFDDVIGLFNWPEGERRYVRRSENDDTRWKADKRYLSLFKVIRVGQDPLDKDPYVYSNTAFYLNFAGEYDPDTRKVLPDTWSSFNSNGGYTTRIVGNVVFWGSAGSNEQANQFRFFNRDEPGIKAVPHDGIWGTLDDHCANPCYEFCADAQGQPSWDPKTGTGGWPSQVLPQKDKCGPRYPCSGKDAAKHCYDQVRDDKNVPSFTCVDCVVNSQCHDKDLGNFCNANHACMECGENAHCESYKNNVTNSANPTCNTNTDICDMCQQNSDCSFDPSSEKKFCAVTKDVKQRHVCVACNDPLLGPTTNVCAPGVCDAGVCRDCVGDAECKATRGPNAVCQANKCVQTCVGIDNEWQVCDNGVVKPKEGRCDPATYAQVDPCTLCNPKTHVAEKVPDCKDGLQTASYYNGVSCERGTHYPWAQTEVCLQWKPGFCGEAIDCTSGDCCLPTSIVDECIDAAKWNQCYTPTQTTDNCLKSSKFCKAAMNDPLAYCNELDHCKHNCECETQADCSGATSGCSAAQNTYCLPSEKRCVIPCTECGSDTDCDGCVGITRCLPSTKQCAAPDACTDAALDCAVGEYCIKGICVKDSTPLISPADKPLTDMRLFTPLRDMKLFNRTLEQCYGSDDFCAKNKGPGAICDPDDDNCVFPCSNCAAKGAPNDYCRDHCGGGKNTCIGGQCEKVTADDCKGQSAMCDAWKTGDYCDTTVTPNVCKSACTNCLGQAADFCQQFCGAGTDYCDASGVCIKKPPVDPCTQCAGKAADYCALNCANTDECDESSGMCVKRPSSQPLVFPDKKPTDITITTNWVMWAVIAFVTLLIIMYFIFFRFHK